MASVYKNRRGERTIRDWCTAQLAAWPRAHDERTCDVIKASTHLVTAGEGPVTLIYVPGTNRSVASSLPFVDALADSFRVVAVDVVGQPGLSTGRRVPRGGLNYAGRWLDGVIAEVRATEGPKRRLVIAGSGLGAGIVLSSRRSDVERAVISPIGLTEAKVPWSLRLARLRWRLRPSPESSEAVLVPLFSHWVPRPELTEWFTVVGQHAHPEREPEPLNYPSGFKTLQIISGRNDVLLPEKAVAKAAKKKLRVTPTFLDGGHALVDELPDAVAAALASRWAR